MSGNGNTELKIIDTMSRNIGKPTSINELTKEIKRLYGSAYYANTYNSLQELWKERFLTIEKFGNSSIASFDFTNYLTPDLLTEMELKKKREFLANRPELQPLFESIEDEFRNSALIKSITLINPERNIKLNKADLLIILDGQHSIESKLHEKLRSIQKRQYLKINPLFLRTSELLDFLKSKERNPLKEMLYDKLTFYLPQDFWAQIRNAYIHGFQISFEKDETNPARMSESDLMHNLARFGYKEIGPEMRQGQQEICIEYIITSILLKDDARRIDAIPIILAKNKANYELLGFLSRKYGLSERLLGLLIALNQIKPSNDVERAIGGMQESGIKEIKISEKSIRDKMLLYNAI